MLKQYNLFSMGIGIRRKFAFGFSILMLLAFFSLLRAVPAHAAINSQINFQGKLTNPDGTNVTDGTYSIRFRIYNSASLDGANPCSANSCLWEETQASVSVSAGIFQVNLGSVTSLPGSVDFNTSGLYLGVKVGSDAEMTPRIQFTATPYAFNSSTLNGLSSSAFGQLSSNQTWTGTNTLQPTTNITSAIIKQTSAGSPTADILNVQTANATNILQVTGPTANEAAVTLNSVGATRALTLDSGSGTIVLGTNTTTLQKSGTALTFDVNSSSNSTLTITNAGTGVASLAVEGGITATGLNTAAGTNTSLGNSTGTLTVASGGTSAWTNTSGNLTISTATSGTLAVTSAGALTVTGAAPSTWSTAGTSSNLIVRSGATTANTALTIDTNAVAGGSGGLTTTTGNASAGVSGANNISTGSGTTSSGIIALLTGSASTGTAGNITLDVGTSFTGNGSILIGNAARAQTVTVGNTTGATAVNIQSGSGNINLSPSAGNDVVFSEGAGSNMQITASAVPTVDQFAISNAGQGVTTAGINGFSVNYVGGNAAVESSAVHIDLTPGGTSGGTWSGLRIVANGTGPVSGVTEYGVKVEGPTSPGAGTETGMYIGTGWDTGLDVQSGGLNLAGYTSGGNPADPAAPAADNLRVYAKKVSGRMLLKFMGPSGVDSPFQPALFGNNIVMYTATSGTTVTGGFGALWAKGSSAGTVSTPTPATTAPAMTNQIHRTRHQNVVTTTNQAMGIRSNAADSYQFWTGNAAGLGGFFFNTRFDVDSYPAATIRIFAGLASSASGEVVTSDTVAGDVVGLWHDTTDAATKFNLVTRNNTTTTKAAINLSNAIAVGNTYDFFMFVKPNDTTVYYRLDDVVNGVTYEGNTSTTMPRNTVFLAPQVEMSNGTANTAVGGTAIGVNRIYIESDH